MTRYWTNEQVEAGNTAQCDSDWAILLMHTQAIPLTKKVVALAVHHLALRLAWLLGKLRLLSLDPSQLVDYRKPHGFIAHH